MPSARDLRVAPISAEDAAACVRRIHYSGKAGTNSQLHFGVFLGARLEGAMQFGPSLQKSHTQPLVQGTAWNGFLELNRMAFSERLPRNSESRALGVALRTIRRAYPHIEWVVSFADGTQCGDGTIYRAAGFVLTGIKENSTIYRLPDGFTFADVGLRSGSAHLRARVGYQLGEPFSAFVRRVRAEKLPGFQLRYVYFLNPAARARLTVPELPFSRIAEAGAGMYLGKARAKGQDAVSPVSAGRFDSDPHAPSIAKAA